MLRKLSEKIGFTQTELKVIVFLVSALFIGLGYKSIKYNFQDKINRTFTYSREDSLFETSGLNNILPKKNPEINLQKVDYKQEVLDFNTANFRNNKARVLPSKESINLNKAGRKELISLPGIGEKTAEKIMGLRKQLGGFKNLKDLMKVKGIGNSKFNKIKKYLYIE